MHFVRVNIPTRAPLIVQSAANGGTPIVALLDGEYDALNQVVFSNGVLTYLGELTSEGAGASEFAVLLTEQHGITVATLLADIGAITETDKAWASFAGHSFRVEADGTDPPEIQDGYALVVTVDGEGIVRTGAGEGSSPPPELFVAGDATDPRIDVVGIRVTDLETGAWEWWVENGTPDPAPTSPVAGITWDGSMIALAEVTVPALADGWEDVTFLLDHRTSGEGPWLIPDPPGKVPDAPYPPVLGFRFTFSGGDWTDGVIEDVFADSDLDADGELISISQGGDAVVAALTSGALFVTATEAGQAGRYVAHVDLWAEQTVTDDTNVIAGEDIHVVASTSYLRTLIGLATAARYGVELDGMVVYAMEGFGSFAENVYGTFGLEPSDRTKVFDPGDGVNWRSLGAAAGFNHTITDTDKISLHFRFSAQIEPD